MSIFFTILRKASTFRSTNSVRRTASSTEHARAISRWPQTAELHVMSGGLVSPSGEASRCRPDLGDPEGGRNGRGFPRSVPALIRQIREGRIADARPSAPQNPSEGIRFTYSTTAPPQGCKGRTFGKASMPRDPRHLPRKGVAPLPAQPTASRSIFTPWRSSGNSVPKRPHDFGARRSLKVNFSV